MEESSSFTYKESDNFQKIEQDFMVPKLFVQLNISTREESFTGILSLRTYFWTKMDTSKSQILDCVKRTFSGEKLPKLFVVLPSILLQKYLRIMTMVGLLIGGG